MPWTKPLPKPSNFECHAQSPLTLPSQENVLSTSSVCIGTTLLILPSLVMLGKIAALLGLIHRSLISSLCVNCYNFLEVIVCNYTPLVKTILDTINSSLLASSTVHNRFSDGLQSSPAMLHGLWEVVQDGHHSPDSHTRRFQTCARMKNVPRWLTLYNLMHIVFNGSAKLLAA